jgi:3-oxoacyl-[acyl-carrier protein] reductase
MVDNLLGLQSRVVVVAGAAGGGIGTTVTRMVAEAGATVIAVSRGKENLDDHIGPLIERGLSIVPVAADVATDDGVAAAMEHAVRADGDLHGLVNPQRLA